MNPFEPPREAADFPAEPAKKVKKPKKLLLFSAGQIALAALLGGPLSGAWLVAWNYRAFGQHPKSPVTLACGLFGNLLCVATVRFEPVAALSLGPFASALLLSGLTRTLQGAELDRLLERGAKQRPWTLALGIGVLGLYFFFVVLAASTGVLGQAEQP